MALIDQRQRCPECLRLLDHPARIGQLSHTFLDRAGLSSRAQKGMGYCMSRRPRPSHSGGPSAGSIWTARGAGCFREPAIAVPPNPLQLSGTKEARNAAGNDCGHFSIEHLFLSLPRSSWCYSGGKKVGEFRQRLGRRDSQLQDGHEGRQTEGTANPQGARQNRGEVAIRLPRGRRQARAARSTSFRFTQQKTPQAQPSRRGFRVSRMVLAAYFFFGGTIESLAALATRNFTTSGRNLDGFAPSPGCAPSGLAITRTNRRCRAARKRHSSLLR